MSQSQTNTDQSDKSTENQSVISPQAREEIQEIVDRQIEDAHLATESDLQAVKEDVAGEVDGLRADVESVSERIPTDDELNSWLLNALSHLVSETCEDDRHQAIRDKLRRFIRGEAESVVPDEVAYEDSNENLGKHSGANREQDAPESDRTDTQDGENPSVWGSHD